MSNNSVDLYNIKVLRASQGMNFHLNIVRCELTNKIKELKDNGYTIYGTDVINGIDVKSVKNDKKYAIIMGNEGNGVKKDLLDMCSDYIYIDMNSKCESLNVGVATSIILYELF